MSKPEPVIHALYVSHTGPARAAWRSVTPAGMERIVRAFAPITAQAQGFQRSMERSGLAATLDGFRQMGENAARARRMEARLIAAAPRDRRPEVRRLLATLHDAPAEAVAETLAEVMLFVDDPFYRTAPSARSWAVVWAVYAAIHGRATLPTLAGVVEDAGPLTAAPTIALNLGRPCTGRPERRPVSRIASRIAANAPPVRFAPRVPCETAAPSTEHRGPP